MSNINISSAVLDLLCVDRLMDGGLTDRYGNRRAKSLSSPTTRHGGAWGERSYSSYSFSTSAPDGGEWSASRPCLALAPGKGPPPPVSIVQEVGWAPEPQRLEEKSFASAGNRTSIFRSSSP
jgi:hypothetical protein